MSAQLDPPASRGGPRTRRAAAVVRLLLWSAVLGLLFALVPAAGADEGEGCHAVGVPVVVPGIGDASLHGELCLPAGPPPDIVQLLVHGVTYTHAYSDWPLDARRYSYARRALASGHAVLNVDRLGVGRSTRPPSAQVTLEAGAAALRDVVGQLRGGGLAGHRFERVIWVGHSFGSIYGWIAARGGAKVDAYVLTGMLHGARPSVFTVNGDAFYPARQDPKFAGAGLDPGYLTTRPGRRVDLFYHRPTAEAAVLARDEELKDTVTATELTGAAPLIINPPPQTAPSRAITVPTLLAVGGQDRFFCGGLDGLTCTQQNLARHEAAYYSPRAKLRVAVIPDAGHSLYLHTTSEAAFDRIERWLSGVSRAWRAGRR